MNLLEELRIWKLRIPFRVSFRHTNADRQATESIWVEAVDSDGHVGYGESCPRSYVTGEDLNSCQHFFMTHRDELCQTVRCLEDIQEWERTHRSEIDEAPAAWCAIELALLELFARRENCSLEQLLGLPELDGTFHYTAVLGDQSEAVFEQQLQRYRGFGFEHFKVKLSGERDRDTKKIATLQSHGVLAENTRVDANNFWMTAKDAIAYLTPLTESFFAIEEPLAAGDFPGLRELSEALGKLVILDESFCRAEQFNQIESDQQRWLINLRVSKMGGLLRSIEIARIAREKQIGLVVGAQVGETSLLTRAALTVAQIARPVLKGQEGAFGKLLLEDDVIDPPLMFGDKGKLSTSSNPSAKSPAEIVRPNAFLEKF